MSASTLLLDLLLVATGLAASAFFAGVETGAYTLNRLRLAVRADQPKLIDFYTAYEFELAEELEYSHANPLEPAPLVMRRLLRH